MKKQLIIVLLVLLGITLVVSGVITLIVSDYKENRDAIIAEKQKVYALIRENYDRFHEKTQELEERNLDLYNATMEFITFFADMPTGYASVIKSFEDYEQFIVDIDTLSDYLKNKCVNSNYEDNATMVKCKTFALNYENSINTYVQSVEILNNKISDYNVWIKDQVYVEYKELKLFESKFSEYVDLNKDGVFTGKVDE